MDSNEKIIGYNTQTGEPIYGNELFINNTNYYKNNDLNNKKSKKIIIISLLSIILVCLLLLFLILFKGTNVKSNVSRTIMIYMVGSDLESDSGLATVDLDEINYSQMDNKNINVLLIAGGTTSWDNSYIDKNETSIYELTGVGFTKVKQQDILNMGSSETLSNFLNYVYSNYKTDKYDLIFWNHGGAIDGSEYDDLSNDNLSLKEMKNALASSPFNENNKLESVMFRTCLNGTIEVADAFKDYANYLVASEEATRGYPLDGIFKFINNIKSSDTGYDVSKKFIDSYKNMIRSLNKNLYYFGESENYIYSTYSIVDLSKIDILEDAINDFFDSINLNENYNTIARVRSNLYQYASEIEAYDMVDLYNLVYNLKSLSPDKADNVLKNIEKVVLYNWSTNNNSRGLSIYFPFNGSKDYKKYFLSIYSDFDKLKSYNDFIDKFSSMQNASTRTFSYDNNKFNVINDNSEADFTLELTDEQVESFARASYIVFRDDNDGYFYPIYRGKDVKLNGNILSANIKDRQLKAVSTLDGTENIVTLIEKNNNDDYIEYTALVSLEYLPDDLSKIKYDAAKMNLIYDKKTKETKIGSIILNNGNDNLPGVVAVNLYDYTNIVFASSSYKILDENGNYTNDWVSNGVIKGMEEKVDKVEFRLQNFDDNYDYYCIFMIWDTNNNSSASKLVKIN